jgi:4-aminobutyrate aminotransferase/(S)-3-amino-2-methylpropionate transaminase
MSAPDAPSGSELPCIRVPPPGPRARAAIERLGRVESPAFGARRASRSERAGEASPSLVYERGAGANVWDVDGNRFVDLAAGFGALLLGHGARAFVEALGAQGARLALALGDLYASDAKVRLLERLAALDGRPGARALLGQSGSDAVTAALKTARLATGRPGVLSFVGAYHGLGYGPLAVCGLVPSWREAFADQLNPHVRFVPFPADAAAGDASLEQARRALAGGEIGAVLVEPVQGRGGCVVPPAGFLAALREVAHEAGALLVADEIWTGLGRSGAMLATSADGVQADLVCLGKGLGGGLPISACVGPDDVMQAWRRERGQEVVHTATFHGAPLACATALATLDAIAEGRLDARASALGARARAAIDHALAGVAGVGAARGRGLMIGVPLGDGARALRVHGRLLSDGWITTLGGLTGEVLVLTPALTIEPHLLDAFAGALAGALRGSA